MSNAIQFLESLGSNAAQRRASAVDYAAAVAVLNIDGAQRQALLDCDHAALNGLLGGREEMRCLIWQGVEESARLDINNPRLS